MVVDLRGTIDASDHSIGDEWTPEANLVGRRTSSTSIDTPYEIDRRRCRELATRAGTLFPRSGGQSAHSPSGKADGDPVIRVFKDGIDFYNPGNAFASREDLVGNAERKHRNPRIVTAFERIGLSDQRGGGLKKIFQDWREFGYFPPEIENNKGDMTFRLKLSMEKLLDEDQIDEGAVSVQARLDSTQGADGHGGFEGPNGNARPHCAGGGRCSCRSEANRGCLSGVPSGEQAAIPGRKRGSATDRAVGKASGRIASSASGSHIDVGSATSESAVRDSALDKFTEVQLAILKGADVSRSRSELMELANYSNRVYFGRRHLYPLIEGGFIKMTYPVTVNSPKQAYILTQKGQDIRLRLLDSS